MKVKLARIYGQVYLLPFIKVTYTRRLNGDLELIIGWWKGEIIFGFSR